MVECLICNEEVRGSIPRWSTASLKLRSASTVSSADNAARQVRFCRLQEAVSCVALCGAGLKNPRMQFVYILQSQVDGSLYIGSTQNVKQRVAEHNRGEAKYSSSKSPYILKWFCAFPNKQQALAFEKYLKHGSGLAFTKKHLI